MPFRTEFAATLRTVVAAVGSDAGFSVDELDDVRLALSEVFSVLVDADCGAGRARVSFSPPRGTHRRDRVRRRPPRNRARRSRHEHPGVGDRWLLDRADGDVLASARRDLLDDHRQP